jgi:hypothetical protein
VRWYLRYGLFYCYRDVEELLAERGVDVEHVTVYRWVQLFTPLVIDAARPCQHSAGDRWFVDGDSAVQRLPCWPAADAGIYPLGMRIVVAAFLAALLGAVAGSALTIAVAKEGPSGAVGAPGAPGPAGPPGKLVLPPGCPAGDPMVWKTVKVMETLIFRDRLVSATVLICGDTSLEPGAL